MIALFTQADLAAHAHAALNTALALVAIGLARFVYRSTACRRDG